MEKGKPSAEVLRCFQPLPQRRVNIRFAGPSPLRDEVEIKFPTATFAVLQLPIDRWSDLEDGTAKLIELTRPRDLDPSLGPELVD